MFKIELAVISHLDKVKEIAECCASDMINRNIFQWNEKYPSKKIFKEDIESNSLYLAKINQEIVGCIMLTKNKDDVYKDIKWLSEDNINLYIHRLAVHPLFQKKGIGRKMMDFAEDYAKSNNYESVRLDTFSKNKRNNIFYENRGYIRLGNVYFPEQSRFPFYCFEKLIN
jgi:ribosomal protein S18 acetylase RimI-like enzyme|tara:strand:+ start:457 stop:966 length:510 start_codon:yes stop_codon:yes gene_type:complete